MKWMRVGGKRRARGTARGSTIVAGGGRWARQFTWTDSETGDVIRIDVRGTPAYLSDLATAGFRPSTPRGPQVVLMGVLALGAGFATWLAGDRGDRTGTDSSALESGDASVKEFPLCADAIAGACGGPRPSVRGDAG